MSSRSSTSAYTIESTRTSVADPSTPARAKADETTLDETTYAPFLRSLAARRDARSLTLRAEGPLEAGCDTLQKIEKIRHQVYAVELKQCAELQDATAATFAASKLSSTTVAKQPKCRATREAQGASEKERATGKT